MDTDLIVATATVMLGGVAVEPRGKEHLKKGLLGIVGGDPSAKSVVDALAVESLKAD